MSTSLHLSLAEYDHMIHVGAFDRLGRTVELVRGELREMNPAGPLHDALLAYLNDWSADHRDRSCTRITAQTGLVLPQQVSRLEPDLLWLCKRSYSGQHPTAADVQLAIEISHSSLSYDLEEKRKLYAEAGICEYWIVDAVGGCIHIFTEPSDGEYLSRHIVRRGENVSPRVAPHARLDVSAMFEEA